MIMSRENVYEKLLPVLPPERFANSSSPHVRRAA